jgi:hypothetical protein
MRWNLERVLFWLSVIAGLFLALTLLNYFLRFANRDQSEERLHIGLIVFVTRFFFAIGAYSLLRGRRRVAALAVVALWMFAALLYGTAVLVLEPFSALTIGIFVGELVWFGLLAYYWVQEATSVGLLQQNSA